MVAAVLGLDSGSFIRLLDESTTRKSAPPRVRWEMKQTSLTIELPRHPGSPRVARSVLRPLGEHLGSRTDDVTLLVSELLANAVEHGQGEVVELRMSVLDGRVRAEVIDGGQGFELPPPDPDPGRGRGLQLVDRLAVDWGVSQSASTHVWFELAL
jgi:anti-sigma regulatory factor (Ser/Thr protein kinase)